MARDRRSGQEAWSAKAGSKRMKREKEIEEWKKKEALRLALGRRVPWVLPRGC